MDHSEHSLAELAIVETNPFKHLTHLTLKVKPGSDLEVKQFLAKCLKQLQVWKNKGKTLHFIEREVPC